MDSFQHVIKLIKKILRFTFKTALWRLSMERLTMMIFYMSLKNLHNRQNRLIHSKANLHLGLVIAFLHPANVHIAGNSCRTAATRLHMLFKSFLFLWCSLRVQSLQQRNPCMAVWLALRRVSIRGFGLFLLCIECPSGGEHAVDHHIVLGKLHSHQTCSLKLADVHGILQSQFRKNLDALHEKFLASCSLALARFTFAVSPVRAQSVNDAMCSKRRFRCLRLHFGPLQTNMCSDMIKQLAHIIKQNSATSTPQVCRCLNCEKKHGFQNHCNDPL